MVNGVESFFRSIKTQIVVWDLSVRAGVCVGVRVGVRVHACTCVYVRVPECVSASFLWCKNLLQN